MEIIDNFSEVKTYKKLDEIDESFFNSKELQVNEFEEKVKTKFLDENDKIILDNFLKKILNKYLIYYQSIVITKNKNHKRNAKQTNINDDLKSIEGIIEKDQYKVKNAHLSRDVVFLKKEETLKFIKKEDLANLFTKTNNEIFKEVSYHEIFREIEELMRKEFINILIDFERIKNLAKFIAAEIHLRTENIHKYKEEANFDEIKEKYKKIVKYKEEKVEKQIDLYFKNGGKTPEDLLKDLKII